MRAPTNGAVSTTELRRGTQRLVCNTVDVPKYLALGWTKSDGEEQTEAQKEPAQEKPSGDLLSRLAAFRAKPTAFKRVDIEEAIIEANGTPDGGTKAELIAQLAGLLGVE